MKEVRGFYQIFWIWFSGQPTLQCQQKDSIT